MATKRSTAELVISLVDKLTGPSRAVSRAVDDLTRAQRRNAAAMNAARGQMMDAVGVGFMLARAVGEPVEAARELESALTDLADKGNLNKAEMGAFGDMAVRLAPQVNQLATDIVRASDFLVGMGLDIERTATSMPAISRAATGTRASIEDLSMAAFAVMDNLKVNANETAAALDVMAYAGKEGGFELRDMAKDFPSMTATMQAFGSTGVPAVADLAAALQIVRKGAGSGAEAATNMNNVLQKIVAPATVRKFKEFGIDIMAEFKKAQAEGKSPIEMIVEQTQRALGGDLARLGELFEDAQVQKGMRPLIQQFDEYLSLRERALAESAGTIDNSFALQMETDREAAKAFEIQMNSLSVALGQSLAPGIASAKEQIIPLLSAITDFVRANPEVVSTVAQAVGGLVAFRIATIATRYAMLFMKGGVIDLALGMTRFAGTLLWLLNPLNLVRGALTALKLALIGTGIGAIVLLIAAAGLWIYNNWEGLVAFFDGFGEGVMAALEPVMPAIQPVIDAGQALFDWVSGLLGPVEASETEWRSWGEALGTDVGNAINSAIEGIGGLIDWVGKLPQQGAQLVYDFKKGQVDPFIESVTQTTVWQAAVDLSQGNIDGAIDRVMNDPVIKAVVDMAKGVVDDMVAWAQANPTASAIIDFGKGALDPFIQWLWDVAQNGLKIAVDIGQAASGFADNAVKASGDAWNSAGDAWNGAASAIGGWFGGEENTRAVGGPVAPRVPYLVGELGPELFVPNVAGTVMTASRTARMLSDMPSLGTGRFANDNAANNNAPAGGSGPVTVTFTGDIVVQGGANATAEDIADAIGREISERMAGAFTDGGY